MNNNSFPTWLKPVVQTVLILAIFAFSLGSANASPALAGTSAGSDACGQLLADAEARFLGLLPPDGSVPATPEVQAAALEYIRLSKQCYAQLEAPNSSGTLQADTPTFIDDGGVLLRNGTSAEYVLSGNKWGTGPQGTAGGSISYSFMGNGISFSNESQKYGSNVAVTSLPGFDPCFITEIQNAFAAWQAVSNIRFVQVTDNGAAFDSPGATGDIRIGAHYFDGSSGTLAHAYFPPPNGDSAAGDLHFDSAEPWVCSGSGTDIGVVALHEIGHTLGLDHETNTTAVMNPYYNPNLAGLQTDDQKGARSIYGGPIALADAPANDLVANAMPVGALPFTNTVDTTGADPTADPANDNKGDGPQQNITCEGNPLRKGTKNVWYTYTTAATTKISFDSIGSTPPTGVNNYDTYIAVWNSGLTNMLGCNDDAGNLFQSQVVIKLSPGTYYIEVAQYNGYPEGSPETPHGGTLQFHAIAVGGGDTVGVFRPSNGVIFLKNQNTSGFADVSINYGLGGDYPLVGDWDGNGTDTIGVYRKGTFLLRNYNSLGFANISFAFGAPGDQPIAGDWDGDGDDTIGVYRPSTGAFYLRNSNSSGAPDKSFFLGNVGDIGIAGDWNNDGIDTTGVFRPSNGVIFLKNTNSTGIAEVALNYGLPGDKPVVGDWDGNGTTTIGVYRGNRFYLRDSNTNGFANIILDLGIPGDMPIAGNWNGIP